MKKTNKRLAAILLVFALMFITGAAYAAANGTLTFTGTANLKTQIIEDELLLEFKAENLNGFSQDDSTGSFTIVDEKQTVRFDVDLEKPGSEVVFTLDLENVGNMDARLDGFKVNYIQDEAGENYSEGEIISFNGTYKTELSEGTIVYVEETVENFTFSVKWEEDAAEFDGQTISFELTSVYSPNEL